MADVFEVLQKDHLEVKAVLAALETGTGDQQELADRLVMAESRHEAAEEMYFWPAVRERAPGGQALADQALQQEQQGKQVLEALRKAEVGSVEFRELVTTFVRAGHEHIAFEEQQVWPGLRAVLPAAEAGQLGDKVEQAEKAGPTRPHPNAPDSPGALKTVGVATAAMDKARDAVADRG